MGCFDIPAFSNRSRNKSGMTVRPSSHHRGEIPPSVVPERAKRLSPSVVPKSPPAIFGILETSNRGCFEITAFSNRSRNESGMTVRGSSQHRGGIHSTVVPESAKHFSGILETSNGCRFEITTFLNRSRNKPRSRGKPGMTGRVSS